MADAVREIERKYTVDETTSVPELAGVGPVARVGRPVEHELRATYLDTSSLDLARHAITLRRRSGGGDAGWHLKLPVGGDERAEHREPLGAEAPEGGVPAVPAALTRLVLGVTAGRQLVPVVTLTTRRSERELLDADGRVLAVLTDDHVQARMAPGGPLPARDSAWREWEVEVADGEADVIDAVEKALLGAGARRADHSSKLMHALGPAAPHPRDGDRDDDGVDRDAPASEVMLLRLREQLAELEAQDLRVRAADPEGIHRMRIAARRLRSALSTFSPLLGEGRDDLRDDLRWLGGELRRARDAQVVQARLRERIAAEESELVLGPVGARLDDELRADYRRGEQAATAALDSDRYVQMVRRLRELCERPLVSELAEQRARTVLPELLAGDAKRLRKRVRRARRAEDVAARDLALHEARKKAKRLRYAAEAAQPALGGSAERLAKRAKAVQEALGEHQDSVVAREVLRRLAVVAHGEGENGFTFGRLHALEEAAAAQAVDDFEKAWKKLRRRLPV